MNFSRPTLLVTLSILALATGVLAADNEKAAKADNEKPAKADKAAKKAAKEAAKAAKPEFAYPPEIPGGKLVVTDESPDFLKPLVDLLPGVTVAKTPPVVDFAYYPGQDYAGKPWSVWGDGCTSGDKYYSAIGDHHSPRGSPRIFEYDPATKTLKMLADVSKVLVAAGMVTSETSYLPGKVHGRVDIGSDGWLYYSTHRGSPSTTIDKFDYKGDWIFRTNPATSVTEIVAQSPVAKHCIPCSVLDPDRMVFYGGTAAGKDAAVQGIQFLAYDLKNKKTLFTGPDGPARYMFLAPSTGRVYYGPGGEGPTANLMRFHPEQDKAPTAVGVELGMRSCTQETKQGFVYTVSHDAEATLWSFNTKTEKAEKLGSAVVVKASYITSLDVDPTGRYLYYVAGAHGGGANEGTPVVQFDLQTKTRKVIAFLHPFYQKKYGYTPDGTFSSALDAKGENLFVTWNGTRNPASQGSKTWETCAMTMIHIPASERP